jgi:hypothetical protein
VMGCGHRHARSRADDLHGGCLAALLEANPFSNILLLLRNGSGLRGLVSGPWRHFVRPI